MLAIGHSVGGDLLAGLAGCLELDDLDLQDHLAASGRHSEGACRDRPRRAAHRGLLRLRQPDAGLAAGRRAPGRGRPPRSRWPPSSTSRCSAGWGSRCPDGVQPNDLVVAIRADDETASRGLAALDGALDRPRSAGVAGRRLRRGARAADAGRRHRRASEANLALVSVPASHAAVEAFDAIDRGVST